MSPPWMPLYVGDYRLDTARLSAAEHGAYLLLIMEHWASGALPDDDRDLARIACMSDREWKITKPRIQRFFVNGWKHKRVLAELQKAADTIGKRRAAAVQMHSKRRAKADAHADAKAHAGHDIRAGTPPTNSSEANASAAEPHPPDPAVESRELFRRGKQVLGSGALVTEVLKAKGGNVALARAVVEQASQAQNSREYVGRILHPKVNGNHSDATSVHAAGRRLAERLEMRSESGGLGGDPDVRLLAQGGRG